MFRFATVLAFIATVAVAEEGGSADPKAAAATDDPLTAAKREFQSIKSARDGLARPSGLDLPRISAPELQLNPGPAPVAKSLSTTGKDKKKKSANWLVDGALKKSVSGSRETGARGELPAASEPEKPDIAGDQDGEGREEPQSSESNFRNDKSPDTLSNPLTPFMASWMTSKDYALLRPDLAGAMGSDLTGRDDPSLRLSIPGSAMSNRLENDVVTGQARTDALSGSSSIPRENPFLQSVAVPAPPKTSFVPPVSPGTAAASPSPFITPVEPPPARAKPPEIARPSDDAKYFKQLKRF